MRASLFQAVALLCMLVLGGRADAALITFFGEDLNPDGGMLPEDERINSTEAETAFLAALLDPMTEDFESFEEGTTSVEQNPSNGGGASNSGTATPIELSIGGSLSGNATIDALAPGEEPGDRYPISGSQYVTTERSEFGDFNENDPLAVTFDELVTAFGFWATDVGDFAGQLIVTITFASLAEEIFPLGSTGNEGGSSIYFGFISDEPITQVAFATSNEDDFIGYDDFTVASATVPEPTSLAFLATGLAVFGWRRRRGSLPAAA